MSETRPDIPVIPPYIHVAGSALSEVVQNQPRISVVDDDVWVGESIRELLAAHGFDALAYTSGADFLADKRRDISGCLIIDQHMPGMKGLDVVQSLYDQGVFIPTILITGGLDTRIREQARQLGVVAVLEKPFRIARLVELVQVTLGSRG